MKAHLFSAHIHFKMKAHGAYIITNRMGKNWRQPTADNLQSFLRQLGVNRFQDVFRCRIIP
jgi:hypothetical protein